MLPNQLCLLLCQCSGFPYQEVTRTDGCVWVVQLTIHVVEHVSQEGHIGRSLLQEASQKPLQRRLIRQEIYESEAPAKRHVEQRDRAVGRVHRPNNEYVIG